MAADNMTALVRSGRSREKPRPKILSISYFDQFQTRDRIVAMRTLWAGGNDKVYLRSYADVDTCTD